MQGYNRPTSCEGRLVSDCFILIGRFNDSINAKLASHAFLLQILSAYTGEPAENLAFLKGLHGKPALISDGTFPSVQFGAGISSTVQKEYSFWIFSSEKEALKPVPRPFKKLSVIYHNG